MPSLAVLATWLIAALWMVLLGSPAALVAFRRLGWLAAVRVGLWFGLAIALLSVLITNFFLPLAGSPAWLVLGGVTSVAIVSSVALAVFIRSRAVGTDHRPRRPFPYWSLIVIAVLFLCLAAVAHAVFGAANNWDAGLYHLNAIQYAAEYRVIPGLANLHDRFGVTNSQHLLTAALTRSGWGMDAFRLEVGFFVLLLVFELTLRLIDTRKSGSQVGTVVLLLATAGLIPFLLSQPDEQLTSPTPDTASMIVLIVAAAFLVDGLRSRRIEWIATGLVTASAAASIRSQLWVFVAMTVVVLAVWAARKRDGARQPRTLIIASGLLSVALAVTTQIRDAIQSGWLLFPLDVWALPVDWRFPDPSAARVWIVTWAREPGANPSDVTNNWSWVGGWLWRSTADWSIRWMLGCLALAGTIWLARRWLVATKTGSTRNTSRPSLGAALLLMVPLALAVLLWFLSAPDPRFAWGPLALLGVIPAAVATTAILGRLTVPIAAGLAALILLPSTLAAISNISGMLDEGEEVVQFAAVPWTVTAGLTPVPQPEVTAFGLSNGGEVLQPNGGDRCWQTFPLCTPYPNADLVFRGDSLQNGLANRYFR
jgi:hypothetical protein